jgi:hypothetical protein
VPKQARSGFNSLVSLVVWCFWKQRNACVFDGVSPEVPRTILDIRNEATLWCMAGAKDLSSLCYPEVSSQLCKTSLRAACNVLFWTVHFILI